MEEVKKEDETIFFERYGRSMREMHDHFFDMAYPAVLKEILPARPWTKRDPKNELAADHATHDWAFRAARIANIFAHHVVDAALELARTGRAEIAQEETFGPLRLRRVVA